VQDRVVFEPLQERHFSPSKLLTRTGRTSGPGARHRSRRRAEVPIRPAIAAPLGRVLKMPCVCFEAQTGKHLLGLNLTAFDPGAAVGLAP
jgi:hypothetical protein